MALSSLSFYSKALGFKTRISVYLPQPDRESTHWTVTTPPGGFPVMFLLHGYAQDEAEWIELSSIGRYIENYPLVVVMPSVGRSTFVDIGETHRYWTYLTEELPALAQTILPISTRREDTYMVGLSMGGYGAYKIGLTYPERYAAVASISGVLDFAQAAEKESWWVNDRRINYGEHAELVGGPHDLFYLARRMAASPGVKPRLYACSGTEDFVYPANQAFKRLAGDLGLDFRLDESPGTHEWGFFDAMFPRILDWLGVEQHHE